MKITRKTFPLLRPFALLLTATAFLSGCQTSNVASKTASSVHPSQAIWRCSDSVQLGVQKTTEGLEIFDSRGFEVSLPPDPPGQSIRYSKPGYAFVIEGRTASWFASKRLPADCTR